MIPSRRSDHAHLGGSGCCAASAATRWSHRARYVRESERHGENPASRVPQRIQDCAWRESRFAHESSSEPPRLTESAWRRSFLKFLSCPPRTWWPRLSCLCAPRDERRALWWILVMVCRMQCSSAKVMLCFAPSFIWMRLVVVLQSIWWRSPLSTGISRPPKRGSSVVMSKRNFATLLWTTTQSSNR